VAVTAFRDALPDVTAANAVTADRRLSLLGAALLWSGWSDDALVQVDIVQGHAGALGPAYPRSTSSRMMAVSRRLAKSRPRRL
jgi:hypothetical protein